MNNLSENHENVNIFTPMLVNTHLERNWTMIDSIAFVLFTVLCCPIPMIFHGTQKQNNNKIKHLFEIRTFRNIKPPKVSS